MRAPAGPAPSDPYSEIRRLSVVIPAHNEERRIVESLEKIEAHLAAHLEQWEILVVDDGSTDQTAAVVAAHADRGVTCVRRSQRGGKGAAVRAGVMCARHPWVLISDADLSVPIEELDRLVVEAARAPIVIGSKRDRGSEVSYPRIRWIAGSLGQRLIAWTVVSGFRDTQCGFKLFRADVARELFAVQRIDGFGFDFEVLFLARRRRYPVREVPIRCAYRSGGKVRTLAYLAVLREIGTLLWNRLLGRYDAPVPSRVASNRPANS